MNNSESTNDLFQRLMRTTHGGIGEILNYLRLRPDLLDVVKVVLGSGSEREKVMALVTLQGYTGKNIESVLHMAISDASPQVRAQAVRLLKDIPFKEKTREKLLALLKDSNETVRQQSLFALVQEAPGKNKDLIRTCLTSTLEADRLTGLEVIRKYAITGLGIEVTAMLSDPSPKIRAGAVYALAHEPGEKETLIKMRNDQDEQVRIGVLEVLGTGCDIPITVLTSMLKDYSPKVRLSVLNILRSRHDARACPAVMELVNDPMVLIRRAAIILLGELECVPAQAVLIDFMHRVDNETDRVAVIEALGKIGGEEIIPVLQYSLQDQSPRVRAQALKTWAQVDGAAALELMPDFLKNDASEIVRVIAAVNLGKLDPLGSVRILADTLSNDSSTQVRQAAANALSRDGGIAECVSALRNALRDKNDQVRMEAVRSLGRINAKEAVLELLQCRKGEVNQQIIAEITAALARLDAARFAGEVLSGQAVALFDPNGLGCAFTIWLRDPAWYPTSAQLIFHNTGIVETIDLDGKSTLYRFTADGSKLHIQPMEGGSEWGIDYSIHTAPCPDVAIAYQSCCRLELRLDPFFNPESTESANFYSLTNEQK